MSITDPKIRAQMLANLKTSLTVPAMLQNSFFWNATPEGQAYWHWESRQKQLSDYGRQRVLEMIAEQEGKIR